MKKIKPKSIFTLILFSILILGCTSIASAVTRITSNGFEDSFPKTAGGYVVWQGKAGNDWEIFLYNANDGSGPVQITDNTYHDIYPETDGRYVTWAAGAAEKGEIFLYDIATSTTTRLTEIWDSDPTIINTRHDHDPKIVDGVVVWISHSVGIDTLIGPGDIILYNIAEGTYQNISEPVDPGNIHDDNSFVFDGIRIQWVQSTSGDTLNWVYDQIAKSWGVTTTTSGYMRNYVYDLATDSMYRFYNPEDDEEYIVPYVVEDLYAATTYQTTESLAVQVDPQSDGDFSVSVPRLFGSDREILLSDRQIKRGGQITANGIEDTQPAIKDNIVVWKGGEGNNSEIYLYEIEPLYVNAGFDFVMDIANVNQMVIRGKAGGGANTQYRWLLGETPLTDWLPVVDGQAPLDLANKSGFTSGPQTLTLEVTDGVTNLSDYITMDLQDWPLQLVSPADSSEQIKGIYPEFWFSSPFYKNFKIQISQTSGFGDAETVTYPSAIDEWMIGSITSFTPDAATTQLLDDLLSASPVAYWRVVARDCYGNTKATETRSFIITPPITLISPVDGSVYVYDKKALPVFVWEGDYLQFKIQFSTVASFEVGSTVTFPGSVNNFWLSEPSITLQNDQVIELQDLLGTAQILYWRVLAQDSYGNEKISEEARSFVFISK